MESNIKLKDQLPDEVIIKIVRRDLIIFLKKLFWFVFTMTLAITGAFMILNAFPAIMETSFYPVFVLFGFGFVFFAWLFFFFSITDYVLDIWYITNKRIVDIQQTGFFSRKISEQYLNRIQDVSSETIGVLPTLFKYGNVRVQTAGEREHFLFEEVPEPDAVRQIIMELIQKSNDVNVQKNTP